MMPGEPVADSNVADIGPVDAIVFAGGRGTRLASVVSDVPKPLAPVAGRPFLDHLLGAYAASGAVRHVVLALGHLADAVIRHYRDILPPLPVDWVVETEPLGTGGALLNAQPATRTKTVLVANGDSLIDMDIHTLLDHHRASGTGLTLALTEVDDVGRFGRVLLDGSRVAGFAEKAGGGGPATRVWTIAGRVAGDRPVTLCGLELRHVFDVHATGADQADFTTGWNAVKVVRHIEHGSWGFIWSGPEPESEVRLPLFLDHGTDIRIRLTSVIDPAILDGIRATLDGVEYPVILSKDGYDRVLGLRANPGARPDMDGRHSLRIILPRTMSPRMINQSVDDDRMLGIAVTAIEVGTFHPLHPPSPRI